MQTTIKELQARFAAPHLEVLMTLRFLERLGLARRVDFTGAGKRGRPGVVWELENDTWLGLFKKVDAK